MIAPVATFARERVAGWVHDDGVPRDELSSQTASAASSVAAWGLLQAVLYWQGSGRDEHQRLLEALRGWLTDPRNVRRREIHGTLEAYLLDRSFAEYRQLSRETLELFVYLKRFARVAKADAAWPG